MSQSDLPEPENLSSLIENNPPLGNAQAKRPARGWKKGATTTKQDALPIEEALKMELTSANNMKTPISVLQELLSRRGLTPQYDLMQVEGAVHEPTFRYRVSYQDKDAMGTGKSKKEAKHAAAQALIDKLSGNSFNEQQHNGTIPIKAENLSGAEEELAGNPIGWLQEMCMARRWPPPTYETETEIGLPHERQFTIACSVLKYREVGKGKSKKIAKRQAAQLMWKKLQDQPLEPTQLFDEEGNESTCLNSTSVDFVQMLNDIASEQRFEVTYVDIDELTMSGRHQCLVQLSTLPVAVCHGSGPSAKDAHAAAARNSLEYLKIMTKT
ncbi:interferon-inducible double-stranded RNA-dependent protein kinase activator A homolog isoform X2 [Toxorhynchites rutilus septentrionalis]|uniref:interferon-inducible double-stranded RNA-dependent protein kinase activator A homolog isoform X2 n=1 Tax=Toxorhynchites rutilus septentrionalis TaxID=329112 RepID=UPI0024792A87|nr:interferon-inducible double-stranded RNA-dependent protein kinase activator A homolog isoform X2 [Toxorhynchites rutilus septentrionalis]